MSTDKQWERWGGRDPYFGVLTDEKFRGKELTGDVLNEFFKTGEGYISTVVKSVAELNKDFSPKRVLDFGCGVGRLLVPLAERFEEVVGVDISPSMLDKAKEHVSRFNGRVMLARSDDELTEVYGNFDFIHSVIVFQHIPTNRGIKIVSRLLSRLNKNGVAVLHFPFSRDANAILKLLHVARRVIPGLHPLLNVARGRPFSDPIMQMNCYDIGALLTIFRRHGIEDVHIKVHPVQTGYRTATLYGVKRP